ELIHAMSDFFSGDTDGVGDGALAGGTVGFDDGAIEAQNYGAAVHFRVHAFLHFFQTALGKFRAQHSNGRCGQLLLENAADGVAEAFGSFENNVAGETVSHDDIHGVIEQIKSFDVTDEIQIELAAQFRRSASKVGALGLFGTVAQNANARFGNAQECLRIDVAHDGELRQMQRLANVVGARIEQHEILCARRHARGDGGAFDAVET